MHRCEISRPVRNCKFLGTGSVGRSGEQIGGPLEGIKTHRHIHMCVPWAKKGPWSP